MKKIIAGIVIVLLSMMSFMPTISAQEPPFAPLTILGVHTNANAGEFDYVEVYANNVTRTSQFHDVSIYTNSSAQRVWYRIHINGIITGWVESLAEDQSVGVLLWLAPRQGVMIEVLSLRNSCAKTLGDFVATIDRGLDGVVNDIESTPNCVY